MYVYLLIFLFPGRVCKKTLDHGYYWGMVLEEVALIFI